MQMRMGRDRHSNSGRVKSEVENTEHPLHRSAAPLWPLGVLAVCTVLLILSEVETPWEIPGYVVVAILSGVGMAALMLRTFWMSSAPRNQSQVEARLRDNVRRSFKK